MVVRPIAIDMDWNASFWRIAKKCESHKAMDRSRVLQQVSTKANESELCGGMDRLLQDSLSAEVPNLTKIADFVRGEVTDRCPYLHSFSDLVIDAVAKNFRFGGKTIWETRSRYSV